MRTRIILGLGIWLAMARLAGGAALTEQSLIGSGGITVTSNTTTHKVTIDGAGIVAGTGLTNFYNYAPGNVGVNGDNSSFDVSGLMSEVKFHHVTDNFDFCVIGYDDSSNWDGDPGVAKAGQFALLGAAATNYGNLCGWHVLNTRLGGDARAFVIRIKDPAGSSGVDGGGYTLFENRATNGANWESQTYNNWLGCDEQGRMMAGALGQASDNPQSGATKGALHGSAWVTIIARSALYPQFGLEPSNLCATATSGALENDGTNIWYTDKAPSRMRLMASATNDAIAMGATGYTNTTAAHLVVANFLGTAVVQTNATGKGFKRGTIANPIDITLKPGAFLIGTSCTASNIFGL